MILETCKELGVPLADEKQEGPTTKLTLLGIQIDTEEATLSLPPEKLLRLQQEVAKWVARKSCTRKELESLLGTLQFACRVIPAGRSFLRRMIPLLSHASLAHHHIRLSKHFRSDLAWWKKIPRCMPIPVRLHRWSEARTSFTSELKREAF